MSMPKTELESNDAAVATMERYMGKSTADWYTRLFLGFVLYLCKRFVTGMAEIEDLQERVRELEAAHESASYHKKKSRVLREDR